LKPCSTFTPGEAKPAESAHGSVTFTLNKAKFSQTGLLMRMPQPGYATFGANSADSGVPLLT
jgi:hypothetical protein